MVESFYKLFMPILLEHSPLRHPKNTRFPVWFSIPLIKSLKEKDKFHFKYKIYKNLQDKLAFNTARKRCDKLLLESFAKFKENSSLMLKKNPKYIWRYVNNLKSNNSSLPDHMYLGTKTAIGGQEICNLFLEQFISVYRLSCPNTSNSGLSQFHFDQSSISPLCDVVINESDVRNALYKLPNKGAGPDTLPSIVLSKCAQSLCTPLTLIYQKSLSSGLFPSRWKLAFITPIHKKGDLANVENYRPVSILSGLGKLLESLVVKKVYWHISQLISINQHGFLPRRSTATNLLGYVSDILEVLDKGGEAHAIYTDFSKAFDLVNHDLLLAKLQCLGIHGSLLRWLKSYLLNRSQLVVAKGFRSSEEAVPSGVPQGSHLGPLLFLTYINDLPGLVHSKVKLFADDLKLYRSVCNNKDVEALQADINIISQWCSLNHMKLNASKCFFIKFSRKRVPLDASYAIENISLTEVSLIRDLGVVIDNKLCFRDHIDSVVTKSMKIGGFVIRQSKIFRNPSLSIHLFESLVRSVLEYCSVVWNPVYKVHSDRLERVQKTFLYHLTYMDNLCKSLRSYKSRLDHYQIMPLEKRRNAADIIMLYKLISGIVDCPDMLNRIIFRVPRPGSRMLSSRRTFALPTCRTNMLKHSSLYRMCDSYEKLKSEFDVFAISSLTSAKRLISKVLSQDL